VTTDVPSRTGTREELDEMASESSLRLKRVKKM